MKRVLQAVLVTAVAGAGLVVTAPTSSAAPAPPPYIPPGGTVTIQYRLPQLTNPAACGQPPVIQFEIKDARGVSLAQLPANSYPVVPGVVPAVTWSTPTPGDYYLFASFPKPPCPVNDPTPPGVTPRYPVATGSSIGRNHHPGSSAAWTGWTFQGSEIGKPAKRINTFRFPAGVGTPG